MPSVVHVIVVGAGSRGKTYSDFATFHPERMQVFKQLYPLNPPPHLDKLLTQAIAKSICCVGFIQLIVSHV